MASKKRKMTDADSQSTGGQRDGAEIHKIMSAVCNNASSGPKIVKIGQAGGINDGSTVIAALGGQTTLGEGTTYFEAAQTGGITRGGGTTAATMHHNIVTSSAAAAAAAAEQGEPSGRGQGLERKVDQLTFGNGKTGALLLSGAGTASDIKVYKGDVELMKTLLTSEKIGLSEDLVFSVWPKPGSVKQTTKKQTEKAIGDLKEELEDSEDNNFIFYYSGHFSKTHQFKVDTRADPSQDYYKDEDLARMLLTIPAKHVLLILDMCYSGRANVGAKDGDELPETKGVGDEEELDAVPRLWECMTIRKGPQEKGDPVKVVQWSSSLADEKSYNLQSSFFTKAIVGVVTALNTNSEVMNELDRGQTHATVLQVHGQVIKHVYDALEKYKEVQQPIIKPDNADTEYFKSFPGFAEVN
ncbi:uncharacterized protein LOC124280573 isoform X3 [Haliotis rubra]|uniref:uncharacterized protein LOC124280573 isoform X3 n=1 Tax=Haliotis rubra TaxID=36100 RepID=UPI001EE5558F|nr:uncharacterized protein LOC124280573 isoform X3 [Haliotis rubra]